ncbi:vomeronasal type-1 receptor 1-like [Trichosurus vulpecula]|uniref:vomeronasal type-1 receptor 1-like n=1 Tax=Trichosurus vulpecula TaxID=9337 RepID=UPI00186B1818|nr:vomeronasal type-1 receptor 1-like [Trichosurus vulpecula]
MYLYNTVMVIIFLSQTGVGVLGNSLFLCFYGFTLFSSHRSRPMDPILVQLTLANTIVLLSQGCPLIIFYLGKGYVLGSAGCKTAYYLHRVSRGLSICTTCLLSVFRAITISPNNSRLAKLKIRVQQFIRPSCLLCWIFSMIVEISMPIYITGSRTNNNSHRDGLDLLYCYWEKSFKEVVILPSLRDIFFVGCMVCTSGYMVFLLYRHHQRIQHIHRTSLSPKTFPEVKATQTILLLVGIFVSAYCISCGFTLYTVYVIQSGAWIVIVTTFIALCFPTISPFLLIHRDTQTSSSCCASWQRSYLYAQNS